jgi:hypothetical protein
MFMKIYREKMYANELDPIEGKRSIYILEPLVFDEEKLVRSICTEECSKDITTPRHVVYKVSLYFEDGQEINLLYHKENHKQFAILCNFLRGFAGRGFVKKEKEKED